MFTRLASIFFYFVSILVLAGVVSGAPADIEVRDNTVNQCNTGEMHCCDSTFSSSSTTITSLFNSFGFPLPAPNSGLVGIACSTTTMGGIGSGASCVQQPVCCNNVQFNGLVNVGCSPISIHL